MAFFRIEVLHAICDSNNPYRHANRSESGGVLLNDAGQRLGDCLAGRAPRRGSGPGTKLPMDVLFMLRQVPGLTQVGLGRFGEIAAAECETSNSHHAKNSPTHSVGL